MTSIASNLLAAQYDAAAAAETAAWASKPGSREAREATAVRARLGRQLDAALAEFVQEHAAEIETAKSYPPAAPAAASYPSVDDDDSEYWETYRELGDAEQAAAERDAGTMQAGEQAAGDDGQEFQVGQQVTWTGCAGLFRRTVTVQAARRSGLLILGQEPGTGPWIYDIHDAEVIKGTVYSIPAGQLRG